MQYKSINFDKKGWTTFWAIFLRTHPVTLPPSFACLSISASFLRPGLPDLYAIPNIPKRGKIYQRTSNYTKWPYIASNGQKLLIQNGRKKYQHFPFQGPPKYTQIRIFGLKINHLATLRVTRAKPLQCPHPP
jgi:hypothetical protein